MNNKAKRIWKQFWKDVWGKDANRGVTLSYSWLANQFGHVALGALAALVFYAIFLIWSDDQEKRELFGLWCSVGIWIVVEIIMFGTTYKKWRQTENYPFRPNLKFLTLDLLTDLGYFQLGAVVFYLPHHMDNMIVWYAFVGLLTILFIAFIYWFDIRIHQQEAHLPFSFHLARWKGKMDPQMMQEIEDFTNGKSPIRHFLLFGEVKSEKSALAVAIGNEMVNRKNKTYYVTINEFLRLLYEGDANLQDYRDGYDMWQWTECDVLVIDHINPGNPVPVDLIYANDMEGHILNGSFGDRNKAKLASQKVIWSVGDLYREQEAEAIKQNWKSMLINLGVQESEIKIVKIV
jgi:hypothetical protein